MSDVRAANHARQQFVSQLEKAREVWTLYPDKTEMRDAERLRLILVLIDLQMSYLIDIGLDGGDQPADQYIGYLCILLSVAATGYRNDRYPEIIAPENLPGLMLHAVPEV